MVSEGAEPGSSSPPDRRRTLWTRLALFGFALLVFFAIGEILARAFHLVDLLNGFPRATARNINTINQTANAAPTTPQSERICK